MLDGLNRPLRCPRVGIVAIGDAGDEALRSGRSLEAAAAVGRDGVGDRVVPAVHVLPGRAQGGALVAVELVMDQCMDGFPVQRIGADDPAPVIEGGGVVVAAALEHDVAGVAQAVQGGAGHCPVGPVAGDQADGSVGCPEGAGRHVGNVGFFAGVPRMVEDDFRLGSRWYRQCQSNGR